MARRYKFPISHALIFFAATPDGKLGHSVDPPARAKAHRRHENIPRLPSTAPATEILITGNSHSLLFPCLPLFPIRRKRQLFLPTWRVMGTYASGGCVRGGEIPCIFAC